MRPEVVWWEVGAGHRHFGQGGAAGKVTRRQATRRSEY